MERRGWLGLPRLGFTPRPRTVACVLSGGGARASFQLGALSFLYEHDPRFTPSIFVGTSAGSILASGLAQSTKRAEQQEFIRQLSGVWRSLRDSEQMFQPRPWLRRAEQEMPGWLDRLKPSPPVPDKPSGRRLPFLGRGTPTSPSTPESPPSPLDPIDEVLDGADEDLRPDWSFGTLAQVVGNLGRLPRLGNDLASIWLGMDTTRSMYRPGPVLAKLLDPDVFDEARVATAGTTLRISMVSLETGELRYMREDGRLVDREDRVVDSTRHRLSNGVLASCSIPGVFRPVPIGEETYVDGSARENLPAEMAIGHLRAERTYVVSSSADGVTPRGSMAEADMLTAILRSTDILMDEATRDELAYALSTDAVVIHPELSVHDSMTVHPGLVAINHDYGWMRAAEQLRDASKADQENVRTVTSLRMRAVRQEEKVLAEGSRSLHAALATTKRQLRDAVAATRPELLPPGAESWCLDWEPHPDPSSAEPSWLNTL